MEDRPQRKEEISDEADLRRKGTEGERHLVHVVSFRLLGV